MAADIFNYTRTKGDVTFSSQNSLFTMSSVSDPIGYLVQNFQTNYQQNVQEIFELGSSALYWSKGHPVGQGSIGRIIGAKDADTGGGLFFPKEAYDVCKGGALVAINARSGSCEGGTSPKKVTISMDGTIVTGMGFSMQAGQAMLNENLTFRFASMSLTSGS